MLFWDDFSQDGELGPEPAIAQRRRARSACNARLDPGARGDYTFLLAGIFPIARRRGAAGLRPRATRIPSSATTTARALRMPGRPPSTPRASCPSLEARTRRFATVMRESTLPPARDRRGHGEPLHAGHPDFASAPPTASSTASKAATISAAAASATARTSGITRPPRSRLFPSLARSLRKAAFGYSQDERGGMRFRQMLPDGIERFGYAAADGQMGQIIKAYLDWQLSRRHRMAARHWPKIQRRRWRSPGFRAAGMRIATA